MVWWRQILFKYLPLYWMTQLILPRHHPERSKCGARSTFRWSDLDHPWISQHEQVSLVNSCWSIPNMCPRNQSGRRSQASLSDCMGAAKTEGGWKAPLLSKNTKILSLATLAHSSRRARVEQKSRAYNRDDSCAQLSHIFHQSARDHRTIVHRSQD